MSRKFISSDEAVDGKVQHTSPCSDCPMTRDSIPGWLGGATAVEYRQLCHSDHVVDCHAINNTQCAGVAIYRANVCKMPYEPNMRLPRDTTKVFASPMEFEEHHTNLGKNRK